LLLAFNNYQLDTELFVLRSKDKLLAVEPQVFDLLVYLIQNRERIISRQELLDELWAGKVVTESTLSSRIKMARRAIGDNGKKQNCIATFNRRGYRFVAEVENLALDSAPKERVSTSQPSSHTSSSISDRPSLAVMPFAHNHGNDVIAWTAEMLGEDINILLARIPGFIVVSRNSTAYYRGREISIGQIGRELGTDYVIEGSVWETGDQLRVSVQLLESSSGRFLWAKRTEVPADKLDELRDDMIHEIVGHIEPELNRAELSTLNKRRTVDLGAWALYRQGHATLSLKGWSEESFGETADLLRQAIIRDPELAFAHAYLALILAIGHLVGLVSGEDWREEAVNAAEAAIALDNQDSDILGYAGCAFADMGDLDRGIGMMQRSVELDPSNAQAHAALGAALLHIGNPEGIEEMRYGMHISPRDNRLAAWGALLARALLSMGKVDEAIEAADYACRCDDKIFLPRLVLAVAQNTAGNTTGASFALGEARRIRPQLTIDNIARFASPDEIDNLKQAGLLS
jgi:TolB-like protein/tetratricopeptide (TPR) repeat protein